MSLLASEIPIDANKHFTESKKDIYIFQQQEDSHVEQIENIPSESDITVHEQLISNFENMWAIFCNKVYQGAVDILRAIYPHRLLQGGILTSQQQQENRIISAVSDIAEKLFGRVCGNC